MGGVTTAVVAIVGILLGWAAIEVACKPCLQRGRSSLFKSLDPDYDPDDELDNQQSRRPEDGNDEEQDDDAAPSSSIDEKKLLK